MTEVYARISSCLGEAKEEGCGVGRCGCCDGGCCESCQKVSRRAGEEIILPMDVVVVAVVL